MTDEAPIVPGDATNDNKKAGTTPQQVSPAAAPVFPTPAAPQSDAQSDIARILQEVKLPERHAFKATADVPAEKPQQPEPEASILEERIVKAASKAPEPGSPTATVPVPTDASEMSQDETTPHAGEDGSKLGPASAVVIPVRTLKDDLQTIVREKKISLVRAVSLEEEKKKGQAHLVPEQQEIQARRSRRTTGILFASFVFITLGFAALFGVFYVMQKQQAPAPVTTSSSILFAEQTEALALSHSAPQDLKNELAAFTSKPPGPLGSITRVVPTIAATDTASAVRPATLAEFFNALDIHPPQDLMGAIGPDFFFGVHVVDKNAPVFVIPVRSYDHAFAGMLAWEAAMNGDLAPIFTPVSMTKYIGTSTVPVARTFQDIVLRNYDSRALEDDSGTIQLYYSFPTPNILIIAESPYSFPEILSRLQAQREL